MDPSAKPDANARTPMDARGDVRALALRAQRGERDAFAELVRRFEAPLHRFLWVRMGSAQDAEELCQETFLRAWTRIETYQPRWQFSTWLFTVARRLAASHRRSAAPIASNPDLEHTAGSVMDPGESAGQREEGVRVWQLAAQVLTPDQRSALWLRYGEELSIDEIAHTLGRRPVAVRVMLFRARERLAQRLASREDERVVNARGILRVAAASTLSGDHR